MKNKDKNDPCTGMILFLSRAIAGYLRKYPQVSQSALADKMGVTSYCIAKLISVAHWDLEKQKDAKKSKNFIKKIRIDGADLWKLINFFRKREVLEKDLQKEFEEKLASYFGLEGDDRSTLTLWREDGTDLICYSGGYNKNLEFESEEEVLCESQKLRAYEIREFEQFAALELCSSQEGTDFELLEKVLGDSALALLLDMKGKKLLEVSSDGKWRRMDNLRLEIHPETLKLFIIELVSRYFRKCNFGKGRSVSGCALGKVNSEGLLFIQSLMANFAKDLFLNLNREKYQGDIPIGAVFFMDALLNDLPEIKRKFSRKEKPRRG